MGTAQQHLDLITRVRDHLRVDLTTCPWEEADTPPNVNRVLRMLWEAQMAETRYLLAEECDRLIAAAASAGKVKEAA